MGDFALPLHDCNVVVEEAEKDENKALGARL